MEWGTFTVLFTEASEACSPLVVCLGFFVTSWMSRQFALGGLFGRLAIPGKNHHCSKLSPSGDNGSHCGFVTLSRQIETFFLIK